MMKCGLDLDKMWMVWLRCDVCCGGPERPGNYLVTPTDSVSRRISRKAIFKVPSKIIKYPKKGSKAISKYPSFFYQYDYHKCCADYATEPVCKGRVVPVYDTGKPQCNDEPDSGEQHKVVNTGQGAVSQPTPPVRYYYIIDHTWQSNHDT